MLVLPGKGLIDPCPLWDDDGSVWLVHAWAKSRAGFNNVITLRRLTPDGLAPADDISPPRSPQGDDGGVAIIDGNELPGYRTLEGPKLYKRRGEYLLFAPAGGVATGWQSVFRASDVRGPYRSRIVLDQGRSAVNGPERTVAGVPTPDGPVQLRVEWRPGGLIRFGVSFDGRDFTLFEPTFTARPGRWVGAKVGLFAAAPVGQSTQAPAGFDWFRVAPLFP